MFDFTGAFGGKRLDANNPCGASAGSWPEALRPGLDWPAAGAVIEAENRIRARSGDEAH